MNKKRVSGLFMALCIGIGSGGGAAEASKGIDYYLIKDREKLIHMSVEDYSNNFSNSSSNYYQHFLESKYLEIEYLVEEQGKGPKSYSDDKYVYINDFLNNKNSNKETDKSVMDRTGSSSFEDLKDKLYKLSFDGSKAVYEKLVDESVVEKISLKIGENSVYVGQENIKVFVSSINGNNPVIKKILKADASHLLNQLDGDYTLEMMGEKKNLLETDINAIKDMVNLQIQNREILDRAKEILETPIDIDIFDEEELKNKIIARINNLRIEVSDLYVSNGGLLYQVNLSTSDEQRIMADGLTTYNPNHKLEEEEMVKNIRLLEMIYTPGSELHGDDTLYRIGQGEDIIFNRNLKRHLDNPSKINGIKIKSSDNKWDRNIDLLDYTKNVELYFVEYREVNYNYIDKYRAKPENKVKNFKFTGGKNATVDIPFIIKAKDGFKYVTLSNYYAYLEGREDIFTDESLYASNSLEGIEYTGIFKTEEEVLSACSSKSHFDNTIIFKLTLKHGTEVYIGLSLGGHDTDKLLNGAEDLILGE